MGNACHCSTQEDRSLLNLDQKVAVVLCGPVVGAVTDTSANLLLELDRDAEVTCIATALNYGDQEVEVRVRLFKEDPGVIMLRGLTPTTTYRISWRPPLRFQGDEGVSRKCVVRTLPKEASIQHLQILAVSCNRLSETLRAPGQSLWVPISQICESGQCDILLHLGDQVYTRDNPQWKGAAEGLFERASHCGDDERQELEMQGAKCLQEAYRQTWSFPATSLTLEQTSNLMMWSDNDVLNDFNTADYRTYCPALVQRAMSTYRMYQRQLWDPNCGGIEDQKEVEEWHFHKYGAIGIFMLDLRGNRIDPAGTRRSGSLISKKQQNALERAFQEPDLRFMLLCSEVPFVWERPEIIREKAARLGFLKDHWPYNLEELTWLLDLCFKWKAASAARDVLLLGGDLHVSIYSVIYDKVLENSIRCLTTSPVSNTVARFYANQEGEINSRFAYRHEPVLGMQTFCKIDISLTKDSCEVKAELVTNAGTRMPPPLLRKVHTWL